MIRSDIIAMAKKLIMQGDIDPLWTTAEWSLFFDEAVSMLHEGLVDSESGFFEVRDYRIEPDENGGYQLPEDFYSMIYCRDSNGKLEHLTIEEEKRCGTTGYILLGNRLEIRNKDCRPTAVYLDYYRLPKEMPEWEGGSDLGNSSSGNPEDFTPDPPFDSLWGAKTIARVMQYLAQLKDGTMSESVTAHINRLVDRFTDRLYQRQQR